MRCHTTEWNLTVPASEDDYNNNTWAWFRHLTQSGSPVIGIFPLARHPGWVNSVWKMEVALYYLNAKDNNSSSTARADFEHVDIGGVGNAAASPCSFVMTVVDQEERLEIICSGIRSTPGDPVNQSTYQSDLSTRFHEQYSRANDLYCLENAIRIARQNHITFFKL
ncbi:hypothetical protein LX36DRAFT_291070 [Colletotrichum falcatum]|nr:hypothetical protein LX36DRAFT_291070 [Colletotrichum falcatum]